MKIGTKSLLFGVHQFLIHPIMVLWAWWIIYRKFPKLYELCAIITHDWGYWGLAKMDDKEGQKHPEIMNRWWIKQGHTNFYFNVAGEVLGHSGFYHEKFGVELSPLYKADKLAIALCPRWIYLLLGNLSGEIHEYMEIAKNNKDGKCLDTATQTRWLLELQAHMIMRGLKGYDEPVKMDKQHDTTDVECKKCGWNGNWKELTIFLDTTTELCPRCGAPDSIIELDGVSEDDYIMQELREKVE